MAKKLTSEQRKRIAELIGEIQSELAEIRALLEKRLQQRRAQPPWVLVIAATERELALLNGVDSFCCGIGPVEAALQTARVIEERRPDAVIHIGIAGAHDIEPTALVLGSEAVYCDILDLNRTLPRVEHAHPDPVLLGRARAALPEALVLPIGTTGQVGGSSCDVEAMEGFGVLRACELAGVPAVELRAISNAIGEPDRAKWRFDDAFAALAAAVERVLRFES